LESLPKQPLSAITATSASKIILHLKIFIDKPRAILYECTVPEI